MSAIESQYAARGERSHLSMGMGKCCSKSKGDKGGHCSLETLNEKQWWKKEQERKKEMGL